MSITDSAADLCDRQNALLLYLPLRICQAFRLIAHHSLSCTPVSASACHPVCLCLQTGMILVSPQSQSSSWDVIRGGYGPDVQVMDKALQSVFERYTINPQQCSIGGFSDGASYALSIGTTNGELFSHIVAFSPGFMRPGYLVSQCSTVCILTWGHSHRWFVIEGILTAEQTARQHTCFVLFLSLSHLIHRLPSRPSSPSTAQSGSSNKQDVSCSKC